MTREELKEHCKKQVEGCEMWARHSGEEPHGRVYEEHKLILELLEQESVLDNIRAEIKWKYRIVLKDTPKDDWAVRWNECIDEVLEVIDKYKPESESK